MLTTVALFAVLSAGCADEAGEAQPDQADELPPASTSASDLAALESPHVDTPVQNEFVHVHAIDLPSGEGLSPHEGGPRVIYTLAPYRVAFDTDGMSETASFSAGEVHEHDAGVHTVENVGDSTASFVIFERREAALPSAGPEGETAVPSPSEGAEERVVFEGGHAQVHRVTLDPGARLPEHRGHARAIHSLNSYTVEFTGDSGTREQSFERGDAHYHDPGEHTVVNVGDGAAEFLLVEFTR